MGRKAVTGARVNIVRKWTVWNGSEFPYTWKSTIQAASLIRIVDIIVRVFAQLLCFPHSFELRPSYAQSVMLSARRLQMKRVCPFRRLSREREEGRSNYWNWGTACLVRRTLCCEAVPCVYMCCNGHTPTRFWIAVFINSSLCENRITFVAHDLLKNKQAGDITHTANFTYIYSSSFCVLTFKLLAPPTR